MRVLTGCDWVMKRGRLWARVARGDGGWGRLLVLKVVVIVLAKMAPVSMVILIAKRTSLILAGSRLAQCRDGLTKENRVMTLWRFGDRGDVTEVQATQTLNRYPP